ncbi:Hypothetical predicted protein [Paramuricea clavata]|uniref:Uncharacterized protein n=1 Tax=Paramuricea clavata TaxID=317549 RepID=A0A7D9H7S3_PARCT|nr:Hypothetical predicted protein [Paramuricea clavata]
MRRCIQCSQKQLVSSTANLFVRTIVNQSCQVISYNNSKVSQYLLVHFKTQKSILESSGAEDKFWPTTSGRVGFVNISLLQERKKWMTKKSNLRVNDLVLLVDMTQPRTLASWTSNQGLQSGWFGTYGRSKDKDIDFGEANF